MSAARILVVEDNPTRTSSWSATCCQFAGYEVIEASVGRGRRRAGRATSSPDLILMDLQLPGIDGAEALRRLRAAPETASLRVVAVTAFAMHEDRDRALSTSGFDGYLEKPISVRALPAAGARLPRGRGACTG